MAELEFDPRAFTFGYPVWVCIRKEDPDGSLTGDVMGSNLKGGRRSVAVFTDEDLAERFMASREASASAKTAPVPDPVTLAAMLRKHQAAGVIHISLDDSGKAGDMKVVDLPQLLKQLEGVSREREDQDSP